MTIRRRRTFLISGRTSARGACCIAGRDPTASRRSRTPVRLTKKRMETVDDEFLAAAIDFIKRQQKARKPFFVWFNTTHMHFRTHAKPESRGQSGRWQSEYHDVMIDHDKHVGKLLDLLDELGIADNTFVMYSTDNGPHMNSWPDAGMTPFRNEKNSNWEGAYRVPAMVRWPGKIKAGSVSNEIVSHMDWLPTFLAMAGEPDIKEKLKEGYIAGDKTFKIHLDGYNLLPYLTGQEKKSPRVEYFYFSDDGDLTALALRQLEARIHGAARPPAHCGSGPSRLSLCACRSSTICAPTRTNAPTSHRTPTTTGSSTMSICSCPRSPPWERFCRRSKSFHRGRRPPASPLIR